MRKSQIGLLAATITLLALAACSHVGADWKQAQAADTPEAYQEFLRLHADSEFSVRAQERIKQLAEDRDWQAASAADSLDAYQQFVATHADSKWAQEARVRIENFQLGSQPTVAGAPGAPGVAAPAALPSPAPAAVAAVKPAASAPKPAAAPAAKPAAKPATAAKAPATTHKPVASAKAARGTHLAQLGAFSSRASAVAAWEKLSARYSGELGSLQPRYSSGKSGGKAVVRLQVRVGSVQQVRELCTKLKHQKQPCVAVG
jgi:hypothetical protein